MNETDKTKLAKKNYDTFLKKLNVAEKQLDTTVKVYVTTKSGKTVEDFYWSDHDISPTAVYKWLMLRNHKQKNKIIAAKFPKTLYQRLSDMCDSDDKKQINIDGIIITTV